MSIGVLVREKIERIEEGKDTYFILHPLMVGWYVRGFVGDEEDGGGRYRCCPVVRTR